MASAPPRPAVPPASAPDRRAASTRPSGLSARARRLLAQHTGTPLTFPDLAEALGAAVPDLRRDPALVAEIRDRKAAWLAARAADIYAARLAGDTFDTAGARHGVNRERARQILTAYGYPDTVAAANQARESRAAAADRAAAEVIVVAAERMPGLTAREIGTRTGLPAAEVRRVLNGTPVGRRVATQPRRNARSMPDSQALAGLRDTAEALGGVDVPMSQPAYDQARDRAASLSAVRLTQRYGTWAAACQAAGVQPGRTFRATYRRRWNPNEMRLLVRDYFLDPASTGLSSDFDRWCAADPARPGAQTVAKVLGPWHRVKMIGLLLADAHRNAA